MNKSFRHKAVSLLVFLWIGVLLSGNALACILPVMEAMDMDGDQAVACCADQCREETTPEAAQKACDETRAALPHESMTVSGPVASLSREDVPHSAPFLSAELSTPVPLLRIPRSKDDGPPIPLYSVERYLFTRAFLI